jgi:hypothetical protein
VEVWKFLKVFKIQVSFGRVFFCIPYPRIELKRDAKEPTKDEKETQDLDSTAVKYLMYALLPISVVYSLYSLIYWEHKGYYSWFLDSTMALVYVIGL